MENIREKLFELQDQKYKEFNVMNTNLKHDSENVIGVRIPDLREIAKKIAKGNAEEYLENNPKQYHEEKMLQGFVIGYMKTSLEKRLEYLDNFVPIIDSWDICDCCVSTYKFVTKNQKEVWKYLKKYLASKKEFELRFAVIMLMDYYITEEYIDEILKIYDKIKSEKYYVKMGVAWALSVCYVKFPEKTMKFLKNNHLDDFTYNKALQKIIESYRVEKGQKEQIKKMKRK